VEVAALGLLVLGVALAEPVSRTLAAARWPARDPVGALLVWQAVGLAGGLALVGAGAVYGLAPLGPDLATALAVLATRPAAVLTVGASHLLGLAFGVGLACWLLGVMAATTTRTLRARRRHCDLLDVLATPWPAVPGAHVLDHAAPVAYCLPGRRARLVLSVGTLEALDPAQVVAVLAHERAHLRERHDLVVLPFVAWGATAPFVQGMVRAQVAVAALIEMRADDVAAAHTRPAELACALRTVGGAAPAAAIGSFVTALDRRLARITAPPAPLPGPLWALVRLAAAALVVLPPVALLVS
jgi:Zn-dependent protease with chaperone function